ncbi:MAG: ABC transporter permease [Gemmatimonadaceae bacterium]
MNLLVGSLTMGLLLSLLTLGLLVSYRILQRLDLTVEGSFGVGAAVGAALLARGTSAVGATLLAGLAGVLAGLVTGVVHTRLRIDTLLAGILTSTALYSVMLYVMGGGEVSVATQPTLFAGAERVWRRLGGADVTLFGTEVSASSVASLLLLLVLVPLLALALGRLFRTTLGLSLRAAGDGPSMARAQGIDVDEMVVFALALSNGLVALSGALFAQYQGFANVQMAVGVFATGLASLVLGEALVGRRPVGRAIAAAILGTVAFRLLVSGALRLGLDPNALKLATALLALAVLVLQGGVRRVLAARHASLP